MNHTKKPLQIAGEILNDRILVRTKSGHQLKIMLDDIHFFRAGGNYIVVKTSNEAHLISVQLGMLLEKFSHKPFLRVHRSYIINLLKVDSLHGRRLFINKTEIPIGKSYVKEFNKHFLRV